MSNSDEVVAGTTHFSRLFLGHRIRVLRSVDRLERKLTIFTCFGIVFGIRIFLYEIQTEHVFACVFRVGIDFIANSINLAMFFIALYF